jgi:hypothetical protein
VFVRSGTVGDNFLALRNFLVFFFKIIFRNVQRAFNMLGVISCFGARINKYGVSGVKFLFRVRQIDTRRFVRVTVLVGFRRGV